MFAQKFKLSWLKKLSAASLSSAVVATAASFSASFVVMADDTELYVFQAENESELRPQVLVIFDNSGSMTNFEKSADELYPRTDNLSNSNLKLYYQYAGEPMPVVGSSPSFTLAQNGCQNAEQYLGDYGMYSGFYREYVIENGRGTWQELASASLSSASPILDCYEDIQNQNYGNGDAVNDGLPVDGVVRSDGTTPEPYIAVNDSASSDQKEAAQTQAGLTGFGDGAPVTIYTETYLNWYHGSKSTTNELMRVDIAKHVMEELIATTQGVDFALSFFNLNRGSKSQHGSRVISAFDDDIEAQKQDILDKLQGIIKPMEDFSPNPGGLGRGNGVSTPLCASLYESYLYFSGKEILHGLNHQDDTISKVFYDSSRFFDMDKDAYRIENGKNYYNSPMKACQQRSYVILITDGTPHNDKIIDKNLPTYLPGLDTSLRVSDNYLASVSHWLNNNDVNPDLEGDQYVTTHTIGFTSGADNAEALLKKAAEEGGGQFYSADTANELRSSLQLILSNIREVNASFTSPSVANNNFDRTQTFDAVYYSMFLPNKGPRWAGNIKKFKVNSSGIVIDKNGNDILNSDGSFKNNACSIWTSDALCSATEGGGDANNVIVGGAAEQLKVSRGNLYLDVNGNPNLKDFTLANAQNAAGSAANLATYMNTSESELADLFTWAIGVDVDDEDGDKSSTDKRVDILGDPLHSKPLAINFGTTDQEDIRVIFGTNHGWLHMLKDAGETVSEAWAFMPYELLDNLAELRQNPQKGVHSVYGLDSSPVSYIERDASGVITKAYLYIGMRRGGTSYYALDITNPDNPKLLWKIDSNSTGMGQLAQSWSEPVVSFIPGWPANNTDPSKAKPVLIFGGGYVPNNKDSTTLGLDDNQGRAVFIVDATTGQRIYSFGEGGEVALPGITDSIPNSVAVLDSNSDGLTDRIYASDTGGNIWRMDLPSAKPDDADLPWSAYKFAALGGDTLATDRRFFAEPVVAQTMFSNVTEIEVSDGTNTETVLTYQNVPYDAVVIGTGSRPSPLDLNREDMFFVLQDRHVTLDSYTGDKVPTALSLANLYDVSGAAVDSSDVDANLAFGAKRGWFYDFRNSGEKSLSAASIIQGRVYFSTYAPADRNLSQNTCLVTGMGNLYSFDLHRGQRTFAKEYLAIGDRLPDTPQLVIPPNETGENNMYLVGIGGAGEQMDPQESAPGCAADDPRCVGGGLNANRIYYHVSE